jgi:glutathione S-transferase
LAVKLHRCGSMWLKIGAHPCWRVQKALDEAGIEYEVVEHPKSRGTRTLLAIRQVSLCVAASPDYIELTGQAGLPAIELEDGTVIREESKYLAARIREGRLPSQAGGPV